jgi:NAD(P)-dependent dehydrogenase (short-subunit alcohol dehydrogenase family)
MTANWTANDIRDLSGKTAIVTGANSGIGFETARALAARGATVIMANRNREKGGAAARRILEEQTAAIEAMTLDLADLTSIRDFVRDFTSRHAGLDILCNNAGVMALPERYETADGFEMQFGTNHLGHFALTGLLMDALEAAAGARVVTVSSTIHRRGKVDFDNLNAEQSYSRWAAYGLSKLANLLFTHELQRRLEETGKDMIAVAAHPGWTGTNLQAHAGLFRLLNPFLSQKPEMGALPTLYAATAEDVSGGDYYGPSGFMEVRGYPRKVASSPTSHDIDLAKGIWEVSEKLTGVRFTH